MFNKTKWILAGLLVVTLLAVGVGGSVALAQGPKPPAAGGAGWMQLYWDALAKRLGIPVEKLQQAMQDARTDAANEAVKQGLLTQPRADRIAGKTAGALIAKAGQEAAAKTLGMSTTDLMTALRGRKTLLDLAREKNVDVAKLRAAIADAEKAAVDQAVKDGKLTQAQADTLKANLKPENIDLTRGRWGGAPGWAGQMKNKMMDRFGKFDKRPFDAPPFKR